MKSAAISIAVKKTFDSGKYNGNAELFTNIRLTMDLL